MRHKRSVSAEGFLHAAWGLLAGVALILALEAVPRSASAEIAQTAATVVTYNPVFLPDPSQNKTLALRISAPAHGTRLPVILFSHGAQYSKDDYLPLAEFWAANGFVVIQPTHLESRSLGLSKDDPRLAAVWRSRAKDMSHVIDALDAIVRLVPALKGRLDKNMILAAGHSFGGHTTGVLLGAEVADAGGGDALADRRIKAGVLMAPPGAAKGFLQVAWDRMATPALVIVGDQDVIPGINDAWEFHADPYFKSPAWVPGSPKCLAVVAGVKHYLGGILGTNRIEEKQPDPAAVKEIQDLTLAFFKESLVRRDGPMLVAVSTGALSPSLSRFECK